MKKRLIRIIFIVCRSEIRLKQYINKLKIMNTCKIGLAAILAILLAQVLQLTFAVSAGIVAILSVAPLLPKVAPGCAWNSPR